MAYIAVTYTFVNGSTADATEVNTNFTDVTDGLSNGTEDINVADLECNSITCSGAVTVGTTLGVTGAVTLASTLGVTGATTLSSTLSVANTAVVDSLQVTTAATIGTTLDVGGVITGAATGVVDSLQVTTAATIGGAADIGGAVAVAGSATVDSLQVTTAATMGTTLDVGGVITGAATGVVDSLQVTTAATIGGSLDVGGAVAVAGDCYSTQYTTFTPAFTGLDAGHTEYGYYQQLGAMVDVWYYAQGTSTATSMQMTLPVTAATDGVGLLFHAAAVIDNTSALTFPGAVEVATATKTVECYSNYRGDGWTAANTKGISGYLRYKAI